MKNIYYVNICIINSFLILLLLFIYFFNPLAHRINHLTFLLQIHFKLHRFKIKNKIIKINIQ